MPRFLVPPNVHKPLSNTSHGVLTASDLKKLAISGQIGMDRNGDVPNDIVAQIDLAFQNFLAVLANAQLEIGDVVKINAFCTLRGSSRLFREAQEKYFGKHAPASSYVEVLGLAETRFLIQIEGEAIREQGFAAPSAAPIPQR